MKSRRKVRSHIEQIQLELFPDFSPAFLDDLRVVEAWLLQEPDLRLFLRDGHRVSPASRAALDRLASFETTPLEPKSRVI